jgi:hypothetical protein
MVQHVDRISAGNPCKRKRGDISSLHHGRNEMARTTLYKARRESKNNNVNKLGTNEKE